MIGDIECYSAEIIPFDLRYSTFDEVMKYVNEELDDVLEEKRCSLSIYLS